MSKILMPMMDGGIVEYADDTEYSAGCETCDYGSEYINNIAITLTKYKIIVVLNQMYSYALSESDIMTLLLSAYEEIRSMTEAQFTKWFKARLIKNMKKYDRYVDCEEVLRVYNVQKTHGGADHG